MATRPTRLERAREKLEDAHTEHQRAIEAEFPIGCFPVYVKGASCMYDVLAHSHGRVRLHNSDNNTTRWVYENRLFQHRR